MEIYLDGFFSTLATRWLHEIRRLIKHLLLRKRMAALMLLHVSVI
jgi:hypothetical protein